MDDTNAQLTEFETRGGEEFDWARAIVTRILGWSDPEKDLVDRDAETFRAEVRETFDRARELSDVALSWVWSQCSRPKTPVASVFLAHRLCAPALLRMYKAEKQQKGQAEEAP